MEMVDLEAVLPKNLYLGRVPARFNWPVAHITFISQHIILGVMDIPDDVLESARQMIGAFTTRFIQDNALPAQSFDAIFRLCDFFYQEGWIACHTQREWLDPPEDKRS